MGKYINVERTRGKCFVYGNQVDEGKWRYSCAFTFVLCKTLSEPANPFLYTVPSVEIARVPDLRRSESAKICSIPISLEDNSFY